MPENDLQILRIDRSMAAAANHSAIAEGKTSGKAPAAEYRVRDLSSLSKESFQIRINESFQDGKGQPIYHTLFLAAQRDEEGRGLIYVLAVP